MEEDRPKKKRKSGNEYRKEKDARQREKVAKNLPKITSFYGHGPQPSCSTDAGGISGRPVESLAISCGKHIVVENVEKSVPQFEFSASEVVQTSATAAETYETDKNYELDTNSKTQVNDENLASLAVKCERNEPFNEDNDKYFKKPNRSDLDIASFFRFHPIQSDKCSKLPFSESIFAVDIDGEKFKRSWLTYNTSTKKLFCSVCLVFTDCSSVFCQGFDRYRHLSQSVLEHEASVGHRESVKAKVAHERGSTIDKQLFEKQLEKRNKEVFDRRQVVSAVIDVIKLIGKQGLAYRASEESAHTLDNHSLNHGNFLETILLLCNHNSNLENHVKRAIQMSKALKPEDGDTSKIRGRGSKVSFLSKTTVNKIIQIIKCIIKTNIADEVKEAKTYSVLMDTTTDVSGFDQCVIVLRYVLKTEVEEKIIGLQCVQSSTGESLFNAFNEVVRGAGLDIKNCIANSFDGAANMSGQYKGVSARLQEQIPHHIHTWCYAHSLNLVMIDTSQVVTASISFFGLLQQTQVFVKESHKRLDIYLEQHPSYKLGAIGATRWRSKSDATSKIFGHYHNWVELVEDEGKPPKTVYVELIVSLSVVANSEEFNSKTRNEANSLLQKFLSFETILTAMIFLAIFKYTTPLSDYLQTKSLDFAQAWNLISSTQDSLKKIRDEFPVIIDAAKNFVKFMTKSLNYKVEDNPTLDKYSDSISIESELPVRRQIKRRKMPDESHEAEESTFINNEESFKINVFYVIVDRINTSMETRFSDQKRVYLDLSCFDPSRFTELRKTKIPEHGLEKICSLIPNIEKDKLREELESFIEQWPSLNMNLTEQYQKDIDIDIPSSSSDDELEEINQCKSSKSNKKCQSCIKCAYKLLYQYNMYSIMYPQLHRTYKFLLTIPMTQVSCERAFSKLKLIKTRIRASMTNENLEAMLLMQSERGLVTNVNNDKIINELCSQSKEMSRLLSFR